MRQPSKRERFPMAPKLCYVGGAKGKRETFIRRIVEVKNQNQDVIYADYDLDGEGIGVGACSVNHFLTWAIRPATTDEIARLSDHIAPWEVER